MSSSRAERDTFTLPDDRSSSELPAEEQVVVVSQSTSRLQRLSSSLIAAFLVGVHSTLEEHTRGHAQQIAFVERLENATSALIAPDRVVEARQAMLDVVNSIRPEELQDGMTLRLGARLAAAVKNYGDDGLVRLAEMAITGPGHPDAVSHALRWVGRLHDEESFESRLRLLIRALSSPFPVVRDGAALGLAALGSPLGVPALEARIEQEDNVLLREDLEQAKRHLISRS